MPLTYTVEVQNRIAGLVSNIGYSSLNAVDKAILDGTTTAPLAANTLPAGGVAKDAFNRIRYWVNQAEMLGTTGSGDVDSASEGWFCFLAAQLWCSIQRPDRLAQMKSLADQAENDFFTTWQRTEPDAYSSEFSTLTLQSIRYYCLMHCLSRSPRLTPKYEQIDSAVFEALNELWHKLSWRYRLRPLTATVGTDESVTWSGTETVVSLETRRLYFSGTDGRYMSWADADTMSAMKANTDATAGKPEWFRVTKSGDTWTWQFYPVPDQSYTVRGEVAVAMPGSPTGAPSSLTSTTVFAAFPTTVQPHIKKFCLNRLLINLGVNNADRLTADTDDIMERLLQTIDDIGVPDSDTSTRDVYQDPQMMGQNFYGQWGGPL